MIGNRGETVTLSFKDRLKKLWGSQSNVKYIFIVGLVVVCFGGILFYMNYEGIGNFASSYYEEESSIDANDNDDDDSEETSSEDADDEDVDDTEDISSSSSSIDYDAELKSCVTSPMNKENYLNIESGVLEAAKVDDINNLNQSTQGALTRFKSRTENLKNLIDKNKTTLSDEKSILDQSHYDQLKDYTTKINNYLEALYDYAIEYQIDMPIINDPQTSDGTIQDTRAELQPKEDAFNQAKQSWIQAYDTIANS